MAKITGEELKVPEKVEKMYAAVMELIQEGADISNVKVSAITDRAGIGKGTAYEYFDAKEDIVACAIVYYTRKLFMWMDEELQSRDDFFDQLDFLLDEVEKTKEKKVCFFRFVNMLTDLSEFSRQVQTKMNGAAAQESNPRFFFEKVIRRAVDRGEIKAEMPLEYMVYLLFSQLLTYMMVFTADCCSDEKKAEEMRTFVRTGILMQFGMI